MLTERFAQLPDLFAPRTRLIFLVALFVVFALSLTARIAQLHKWQTSPEVFFSGEVPVAGTDSYHFFRHAREVKTKHLEGAFGGFAPCP